MNPKTTITTPTGQLSPEAIDLVVANLKTPAMLAAEDLANEFSQPDSQIAEPATASPHI